MEALLELMKLPTELLLEVAVHLDHKAQSRLSRTCRRSRGILQQDLFKRAVGEGCNKAMFYACTHPDSEAIIQSAFRYGVPATPEDPIHNNRTPLQIAAEYGCNSAVLHLLQLNADVNHIRSGGYPPLAHGLYSLLKELHQVTVTKTPYVDTVISLLDAGANADDCSPFVFSDSTSVTLILALWLDNALGIEQTFRLVRKLGQKGADFNSRGRLGMTPLQWAVGAKTPNARKNMVDLLISFGADVNFGLEIGVENTAIGSAIELKRLAAVPAAIDSLIRHGADLRQAVFFAVQKADSPHCVPIVEHLLSKGVSVNALCNSLVSCRHGTYTTVSHTALGEALHLQRSTPLISALLEHGANPSLPDSLGETPLGYILRSMVCKNRLALLEKFLQHGANPNEAFQDEPRATPLMLAITRPWSENISYTTPLRLEVIRTLLRFGADASLRCDDHELRLSSHSLISAAVSRMPSTGTHDPDLVIKIFETKKKALVEAGVDVTEDYTITFDDSDNLTDCKWDNSIFPVLFKAGAALSQRDIEFVKESSE